MKSKFKRLLILVDNIAKSHVVGEISELEIILGQIVLQLHPV